MEDGDDVPTVDVQLSRFSRQLWYDASSWLLAKEMRRRGCPCWFYIFVRRPPSCPAAALPADEAVRCEQDEKGSHGSYHGSDVPFWHGTTPDAAQSPAGQLMMRYLLQFASSGDPNTDGAPQWPIFGEGDMDGTMQLGGLGEVGAAYVPLATESRELYGFMEVRYFGRQGRIGDILGQSEPGPAM